MIIAKKAQVNAKAKVNRVRRVSSVAITCAIMLSACGGANEEMDKAKQSVVSDESTLGGDSADAHRESGSELASETHENSSSELPAAFSRPDAMVSDEMAAKEKIQKLEASGKQRIIHALTPVKGQLGQQLATAGWEVVPVTLEMAKSTLPELIYVNVESEEAQSEALKIWLRSEKTSILFDSSEFTETPTVVTSEDGSLAQFQRLAKAGSALVEKAEILKKMESVGNTLANYLADVYGDGPKATAVLRAHGIWSPFHVDTAGGVNGKEDGSKAATNDLRLQIADLAQESAHLKKAEAADESAISAKNSVFTHQRAYAPMRLLGWWKDFRIAGYSNVRTYCTTTTQFCVPIIESKVSTVDNNTLYVVDGRPAGVARIRGAWFYNYPATSTGARRVAWGPIVNAFFASTTVTAPRTNPSNSVALYSMTPDPAQIPDTDMTIETISEGFSVGGSFGLSGSLSKPPFSSGPSLGVSGAYSFSKSYMNKMRRWIGANESSKGTHSATSQVGLWRQAYASDYIDWFQNTQADVSAANRNNISRQAPMSVAGWGPGVTAQFKVMDPSTVRLPTMQYQVTGWLGAVGESKIYQQVPQLTRNRKTYNNAWVYVGSTGFWTRPADMTGQVFMTPRVVRVGRCVNSGTSTPTFCRSTDV